MSYERSSDRPAALVITAAGINCDLELAQAFRLAGAAAELIHLSELCKRPSLIDRFQLIGLPGGFSYGDAIAAGRIAAAIMRQSLWEALVGAIERNVPIIAPCNGFQIAVQLGLLPGPVQHEPWPAQPPRPTAALAANESARFIDRWCQVEVPAGTRCVWTRGVRGVKDNMMLPIAHGEGRFIAEQSEIDRLSDAGQVALRYSSDDNPNGSMGDIAGICDASGLVFGLMPHPERFTSWMQHPTWTRMDRTTRESESPIGLQMFRNAIEHVSRQQRNARNTLDANASPAMSANR